uniref:CAH-II n=1 Tax=Pyrrhocoris apterus TaxID=37000 RepID=U5XIX7_PYRAP|nr:CAH-II [Pyrrhocoris apterus]
MDKYMISLYVLLVLSTVQCLGQLTFTPNWGKRMTVSQDECKIGGEAIVYILSTIETGIKKIIECEKLRISSGLQ